MGNKKNYNKIPKSVLEKVEQFGTDYVKVGKKILVTHENVKKFQKIGINIMSMKFYLK